MRLPFDFQIIAEHEVKPETEKELTISERKKYENYIDKLEKEIERLRGEAKRRNQVIHTLQKEEKEK